MEHPVSTCSETPRRCARVAIALFLFATLAAGCDLEEGTDEMESAEIARLTGESCELNELPSPRLPVRYANAGNDKPSRAGNYPIDNAIYELHRAFPTLMAYHEQEIRAYLVYGAEPFRTDHWSALIAADMPSVESSSSQVVGTDLCGEARANFAVSVFAEAATLFLAFGLPYVTMPQGMGEALTKNGELFGKKLKEWNTEITRLKKWVEEEDSALKRFIKIANWAANTYSLSGFSHTMRNLLFRKFRHRPGRLLRALATLGAYMAELVEFPESFAFNVARDMVYLGAGLDDIIHWHREENRHCHGVPNGEPAPPPAIAHDTVVRDQGSGIYLSRGTGAFCHFTNMPNYRKAMAALCRDPDVEYQNSLVLADIPQPVASCPVPDIPAVGSEQDKWTKVGQLTVNGRFNCSASADAAHSEDFFVSEEGEYAIRPERRNGGSAIQLKKRGSKYRWQVAFRRDTEAAVNTAGDDGRYKTESSAFNATGGGLLALGFQPKGQRLWFSYPDSRCSDNGGSVTFSVFRRNLVDDWTRVSGALKQVSVGLSDEVWGVNKHNSVYKYNGRWWDRIPSISLKHVSVGRNLDAWGVDVNDRIWKYDVQSQQWNQPNTKSRLSMLDVGANAVWGVNRKDYIYRHDGSKWRGRGGRLRHVSIGGSSFRPKVWGVNKNGYVYKWNGSSWDLPDRDMRLRMIDVGDDGEEVWGVNDNDQVYRREGNDWLQVGIRRFKYVSVGANWVWGVTPEDEIFRTSLSEPITIERPYIPFPEL